ncbi:serine hydrolase domain-containing protein [Pontibacter silvestris]|uniref:Serine hydrolase domain-containing protein n=1 Tax=Pontibacter silvestris TaxID=2305183 RepID=A0ABW4WSW1_9BACT|nr:serine hydrolase domain-containing protein [Pontibacter silvestris]MCC9138617.1 beta-lactamase family protein [Pontibacter silvestris]
MNLTSLQDSFDTLMDTTYAADKPGAALHISVGGDVLYERGFGLADLAGGKKITSVTNFRMASVSKQFTAMGISQLEQQGQLSYEDSLLKFFPEFALIAANITLRHLLTHTSGLFDYENFIEETSEKQVTDEEILQLIAPLTETYFTPGAKYRYSNTGFVLLALVVERVSGLPYATFLQENIFLPLHMHASTLYKSSKQMLNRAMGYAREATEDYLFSDQSTCTATMGDGCVYTSLQDYQKWHQALTTPGPFHILPVLDNVSHPIETNNNWFYGMGWFCSKRADGSTEMYHSGNTSGFSNLVIRIPEKDVLIAYFSNIADNTHLFSEFLDVLQQFPVLRLESELVRRLPQLTC